MQRFPEQHVSVRGTHSEGKTARQEWRATRFYQVPAAFALCALAIGMAPVQADAATLSRDELFAGEYITVTGENFGPPNLSTSYLCFFDNTHCVSATSFGERAGWEWSDTAITGQVPNEVPISGDIIVYVQAKKEECFPNLGYCEVSTFLEARARASYTILPKILDVNPKPSATRNQTITITGTGFGDQIGEVRLDSYLAAITSWTDGSITVTPPAQLVGSTKQIRITTGNAKSATSDYRVAVGISNDEYSYLQEYLEQVYVKEAWALAGTNEVIVAVIDDGVLLSHPDLQGQFWRNTKEIPGNGIDDDFNGFIDDVQGYNFLDGNTDLSPKGLHGTAVAGIIGAVRDNAIGIGGIVKHVNIMPLLVADSDGVTNSQIVDRAIKYAADHGASIINLSFSTSGEDQFFPQLDASIDYAFSKGAVVVAAAGNGDVKTGAGLHVNNFPQSPVCNTRRGTTGLGIAALDNTDRPTGGNKIATWSNYGSNCISLSAPGTRLYTTTADAYQKEGKLYGAESGTSFATPLVAGIAALLKATYPTMTATNIIDRLLATADPIDEYNPEKAGHIGKRINAFKALAAGKPIPALVSFSPHEFNAGSRLLVSLSLYDPLYSLVLTPVSGGSDIRFSSGEITVVNTTEISIALPTSLLPGSYRLRLLSPTGEEISFLSESFVVPIQLVSDESTQSKQEPSEHRAQIDEPSSDIQEQSGDQQSMTESPIIIEKGETVRPTSEIKSELLPEAVPNEKVAGSGSRSVVTDPKAISLINTLKGRILLQVESKGEAWYVRPDTGERVFMGRPADAFQLMRTLGKGIANVDLERIPVIGSSKAPSVSELAFTKKHAGKIFIQVQEKGRAWYVHPKEFRRYFLGRPADAFEIMRRTGLGITTKDLSLIPIQTFR
ncbi:S8 family serine peptidase [Candidatus Uhrbacteria bacterium]|nr:S8 family serine peptidase [Candidatus Uhrbacteria bacterium]